MLKKCLLTEMSPHHCEVRNVGGLVGMKDRREKVVDRHINVILFTPVRKV